MPPGKLIPANAPMAFLSDVHGNLPALEAVLAELEPGISSSGATIPWASTSASRRWTPSASAA